VKQVVTFCIRGCHLSLKGAIFWILFSNIIECTQIQKSARLALSHFVTKSCQNYSIKTELHLDKLQASTTFQHDAALAYR